MVKKRNLNFKPICAITLSLGLYVSAANAQQTSVTEISDKRTTGKFFAGLDIKLSVLGAGIADSKGLRRVKIEKAIDDTGRNLLREEKFAKTPFDAEVTSPKGDALDFELSLANPSRQAKTLQEVTGYVELHTPQKDAKSVLSFGPLSGLYGKKLALPSSLAGKLGIIPLNKTLYEDMRKANASSNDGGELVKAFKQMFSGNMDAEALGFIVQGDMSDVVAIEVTDAMGKPLQRQGRFNTGSFTAINFPGGPPPSALIKVYLATPQSILRIPFQLKAVALP
jgi:hypothetical protein